MSNVTPLNKAMREGAQAFAEQLRDLADVVESGLPVAVFVVTAPSTLLSDGEPDSTYWLPEGTDLYRTIGATRMALHAFETSLILSYDEE